MKSIIKINFSSSRTCDLITFPRISNPDSISFSVNLDTERLLPSWINDFLEKIKDAELGRSDQNNQKHQLFDSGFVESLSTSKELFILSYRKRDIFLYINGKGIKVTENILFEISKAIDLESKKD